MFDFHEKRKIRSAVYSRPVALFLFFLTFFLSVSAYNRYSIAHDMKGKLDEKRADLRKMQERADVVESKVLHLKDERGIEEELRNRFDAVQEGEQVIIFTDQEKVFAPVYDPQSQSLNEKSSWISKWFDF